ncbi:MAG: glycosyltransferase [Chloroflexota bacterium]
MSQSPKLAYIVSRFPTVTETFILREMIEVERQRMPISLFTLIKDSPDVVHEEAKPWVERAQTVSYLSRQLISANLRALWAQPILYITLLWITIHDLWGCWNFFLRDVFLFPKAVAFAQIMERQGIEHLHAHWATHTAYAAYIVHRLNGIPFSFTAHAHDIYIRKAMLCRKIEAAAFVATISEFNVRELTADCGEQVRSKIHVVRCGVAVPPVLPQPAQADQPFTILTVASLRDYKGHPYAIQACQLIRSRLGAFQWLVIGGGPDRAALEAQIAQAGVGDCFHLLGAKPEHEVHAMMTKTDLLVMSSIMLPDRRMDGIPVALMEGMALAVPAVATDVSGIPELVENNVTGRLVPERNAGALADAIVELYTDRAKARALGQAGRGRIETEFTLSGNAEILIHLFQDSLKE